MRRLFLVLVLLLWPIVAWAEEGIERFQSDVTVNRDASLDVVEEITVRAEGSRIRHGIFRDFPTVYKDSHGATVTVGFGVTGVQRDGASEPYAIEGISNGKRIRIGSKDVFIDQGVHRYRIAYHATRLLGFFPDHDELYWNVTGNGWDFQIVEAEVRVHLPSGARISDVSNYTGFLGSHDRSALISSQTDNEVVAGLTRTLRPREGYTISVSWQKGIVTPPSGLQNQLWFLMDNLGFGILIAAFLAVAAFFLYAWNKVGRDPPRGTVVPLFHPPSGFGPGLTRYVWRQGYDKQTFVASLIGLASAGLAKISNDDGTYSIVKKAGDASQLSGVEQALYGRLPEGELIVEQGERSSLNAMQSAISGTLDKNYEGKFFNNNAGWFIIGAVISVLGIALAAWLMNDELGRTGLFIGGFTAVWWGFIITMVYGVLKRMFSAHGIFGRLGAVVGLLFAVPFIGAGIAVPLVGFFAERFSPAAVAMMLGTMGIGVLNLIFYKLLPAPTVAGGQVLDQIEGFRLYLKTAEEHRLNLLNPPEKTPQLFERYLPYAMALDCENEWNAKFAAVLAAAAAASGAAVYTPSWYSSSSGSSWSSVNNDFGSSLTSAIASASTPPGSSSGGGGGGSSGGGGGGGGGGGW